MRRQTRGGAGRSLFVRALVAVVLAGSVLGVAGPAQGDPQVTIPVQCDRPNTGITPGLVADLNTVLPDPLESDSLMQVVDPVEPVKSGQAAQFDLNLALPDISGGFPPNEYGFNYGTFYLRSVELTVPLPPGIDASTVTPVEMPATEYVTATRSGGNLVVRIQSQRTDSHPNNYVRINADAPSPVAEVRLLSGSWVPVVMPTIRISPTVTGAPGSTITWKPPTRSDLVIKYNQSFGGFFVAGSINWNDLTMPCTPVDPNQVVATTTVGSPALSVTKSADESAVVAGSPIHFHVTVRNTGNVALTGVEVTDAGAPGCAGSVGNLAVGAQVTRDCTVTTTNANIPTFANTAGADSNETAPVTSNTVNVTVASVTSTGVTGQMRDAVSGTGLGGGWLALLRASDFSIAGGAVADGSGDYTVNVPPGTYLAYGIDPTGRHAGGFATPAQVTVTAGALAPLTVPLAPTRGSIAGTVTERGSGAAVAGAWALAATGSTFAPELLSVANGSGQFRIDDLPTGNHFVTFLDPAGAHAPEYLGGSPGPAGALTAAVTGGGTAVADGTPPAQAAAGTGAVVSGVVSESGTGSPLGGVAVVALRAADFGFVRGGLTDASGSFSLSVPESAYKLFFIDTAGAHHMEWHDDLPYTGLASAASVAAPGVVNAELEVNSGTMAGTITDDPSGAPLAGAWAIAIGPTGIAGGAITGADGRYSIGGLPAGTYRATFVDPQGGRVQEYWNNATTYGDASAITIAGGATTTINGGLRLP